MSKEVERQVPGGYLDRGANQAPDHLPEEVRRHDPQQQKIPRLAHLGALDHHDGAGVRRRLLAEAREVVPTRQDRPGALQQRYVQLALDPPDERLGECRPPARHLVDVAARRRVVPRVEAVGCEIERENLDIGRKEVVHLAACRSRVDRAHEPRVGDLRTRVDAGVGPPRGGELPQRAGDARDRAPKLARDGARVLLLLPTAVARPLVLDDQAIGRHAGIMRAGAMIEPQMFPAFDLVDLSQALDAESPSWPGEAPFRLDPPGIVPLDGGFSVASSSFACPEHAGTHADAPAHLVPGGTTIDALPLSQLVAPGVLVDVRGTVGDDPDATVDRAAFEAWESRHGRLQAGTVVLVATGWSSRWNDPAAYLGTADRSEAGSAALRFPGLAVDAARWLACARKVAAVGIDSAGIDPGGSSALEAHRELLGNGVVVFENLAAPERLPARGFLVLALPLKILGGSAAPARVVALVPRAAP